ncbi:helix-turn-helix domain-containing protein [Fibrobacterota bacterium]
MGTVKNRRFVTTGEIAKICEVSSKTVISWTDRKQLKSFRIGTGPRKVIIADLVAFLTEKGFPIESENDIKGILADIRNSESLTSV